MVFVYYCVMYALCYHVLPLLIFYFIVLYYNVLYGIVFFNVLYILLPFQKYNTRPIWNFDRNYICVFPYMSVCVLFICICMSDNWKHCFLCICVFVYLCICIFVFSHHILGNIIFSSSYHHLFKNINNIAYFVPICNIDQRCICVLVFG